MLPPKTLSILYYPITLEWGGGGGAFWPGHQIIDSNSKTAQPGTCKFRDFYFLFITHVLAEF